jgi:hypothetical protein
MDGWLAVKIWRECTKIIVYNKLLGHPRIRYKDFPKVLQWIFIFILNRFLVHMVLILLCEMAEVIGIVLQGSSKNVKTMHLETWLGLVLQHCSKNMKIVDLETWLSYVSFSSICTSTWITNDLSPRPFGRWAIFELLIQCFVLEHVST